MEKDKIFRLVITALFCTLEIVLSFTPAGYLQVGVFNLTTLHIPVIIAGICFGIREGMILGLVFGFTSFLHATLIPTPDSIFFSPFYSQKIGSLLIALGPRVLLGIVAALLPKALSRIRIRKTLAVALSCILSAIVHTVAVLSLIFLLFRKEYAALTQTDYTSLANLILAVMGTNGLAEAILAALIGVPVAKAVDIIQRRK